MIEITRGRGFHLTFDNGWTISVQIGYGNYCANRDKGSFDTVPEPSPDAEIAVMNPKGEMVELVNDTVQGWVSTEKVADAITLVQAGQIKKLCEMLAAQSSGEERRRSMNPIVEDVLMDDES